ncbi:MAG: flagellar basal-body rod protein FlgF [Halobacteriovoraceae bacterium]|nr:flagellar basal-body rod protein FlgF [Halobacteriovoraceae bacterium]
MKELWVPLSGAIAQQKKVDTIANNIANSNTPGFKKDHLIFKEHLSALTGKDLDIDIPRKEWAPEDFYKSYGAEHAFVKVSGSHTKFIQGQLRPTSNLFDFAINGKGMFEVLTPQGLRYTRNGSFTISNQGELITADGYKVLKHLDLPEESTAQDKPLPTPEERIIQLPSGNLSVNIQGKIFVNGSPLGDLSIVEFENLDNLQKQGNSLYINSNISNLKTKEIASTVHQGFIEESNVNAVEEMSELIKANRQFESIQRVIKTYDNIANKSVNEIIKF